MEEKSKKILGLAIGSFIAPTLFGIFMRLTILIPYQAYSSTSSLAFLLILFFPLIFIKWMSPREYYFGLFLNVIATGALFLVLLGSCAEFGSWGSSGTPGAGTPYFIIATILGIFIVALFILRVKTINDSESPKEKQAILF
ncbi:MAG: hypothetical protein AABX17_03205 [Nanoarchaeota archaeon]